MSENEDIAEYVRRFETAEAELRNADVKLPNMVVAIHLLDQSTIKPLEKQNILTKVDF